MKCTLILHPDASVHQDHSTHQGRILFCTEDFYTVCKKNIGRLKDWIQEINRFYGSSSAYSVSQTRSAADPFSSSLQQDLFYLCYLEYVLEAGYEIEKIIVHSIALKRTILSKYPGINVTTHSHRPPLSHFRFFYQLIRNLIPKLSFFTTRKLPPHSEELNFFEIFYSRNSDLSQSRHWGLAYPMLLEKNHWIVAHPIDGSTPPNSSSLKRHSILSPHLVLTHLDWLRAACLAVRARFYRPRPNLKFDGYQTHHLWASTNASDSGSSLLHYAALWTFFARLKKNNVQIHSWIDWFEGQRLDLIVQDALAAHFPETRRVFYIPPSLSEFSIGREQSSWMVLNIPPPTEIWRPGKKIGPNEWMIGDLQRSQHTAFNTQVLTQPDALILLPLFETEIDALLDLAITQSSKNKTVYLRLHPATETPDRKRIEEKLKHHPKIRIDQSKMADLLNRANQFEVFTSSSGVVFDLWRIGIPVQVVLNKTGLSHFPADQNDLQTITPEFVERYSCPVNLETLQQRLSLLTSSHVKH